MAEETSDVKEIDDFFEGLEKSSVGTLSPEEMIRQRNIRMLQEIDETDINCSCGDIHDLVLLTPDMFDGKELNKQNVSDFLDCFQSKFYTEVYKVDTGHSYVIDSIDLYPYGEYNYEENKLYKIDWSKGASQIDGKVHLHWKEVPVSNFKEFKHALELDKQIDHLIKTRDEQIAAFGPWTQEKLAIHKKWEEGWEKYYSYCDHERTDEEIIAGLEYKTFKIYLHHHPEYEKLFWKGTRHRTS